MQDSSVKLGKGEINPTLHAESETPFSAMCTAFSPTKNSSEMLFKTLS